MEINSDGIPKELKKVFDVCNLTLMEHVFIGSSDKVNGEVWGQRKVEEYLRKEENIDNLRKKLLTPIAFLNGQKTKEEINTERSQKKRLTGSFPLFDTDQQLSLREQGDIYIELGGLGENGQVSGEWKVGLIDGNGSEIDFPEKLELESFFNGYFTLEKDPDPNGKGKILKLNKLL